jgi:hypothetical protein
MTAWECSRHKMVSMKALPIYKRVAIWFSGNVEDTETLLWRLLTLNRGLETRQWRIYERREKPNGARLVFSIDQASVAALNEME